MPRKSWWARLPFGLRMVACASALLIVVGGGAAVVATLATEPKPGKRIVTADGASSVSVPRTGDDRMQAPSTADGGMAPQWPAGGEVPPGQGGYDGGGDISRTADQADRTGTPSWAGVPLDAGLGPALTGPALTDPALTGPGTGGPALPGPAQAGPAQLGPAQLGPAQLGPAQLGPALAGPALAGPALIGPGSIAQQGPNATANGGGTISSGAVANPNGTAANSPGTPVNAPGTAANSTATAANSTATAANKPNSGGTANVGGASNPNGTANSNGATNSTGTAGSTATAGSHGDAAKPDWTRPKTVTVHQAPAVKVVPQVVRPVQTTRTDVRTLQIPFKTRTVRDPEIPRGTKVIQAAGSPGQQKMRYLVTLIDGRPTHRQLVNSTVVRRPKQRVIALGAARPVVAADDDDEQDVFGDDDGDGDGDGDGDIFRDGSRHRRSCGSFQSVCFPFGRSASWHRSSSWHGSSIWDENSVDEDEFLGHDLGRDLGDDDLGDDDLGAGRKLFRFTGSLFREDESDFFPQNESEIEDGFESEESDFDLGDNDLGDIDLGDNDLGDNDFDASETEFDADETGFDAGETGFDVLDDEVLDVF